MEELEALGLAVKVLKRSLQQPAPAILVGSAEAVGQFGVRSGNGHRGAGTLATAGDVVGGLFRLVG